MRARRFTYRPSASRRAIAVLAGAALAAGVAGSASGHAVSVEARWEPATGRFAGTVTIHWVNPNPTEVREVSLVWPSASEEEVTLDGMDVEVRVADRFVAAPAALETGGRRLRVRLPVPVASGGAIELRLPVTARTEPMREGSSGWHRAGLGELVALPEPVGATPTAGSASVRLELELPARWQVVATGVEVGRMVNGDHRRVTSVAEGAVDLTWMAAPARLVSLHELEFDPLRDVPPAWVEAVADRLGLRAADLELAPVHLRLAVANDLGPARRQRLEQAIRRALAWSGVTLGSYPWPHLTVVLAAGELTDLGPWSGDNLLVVGPEVVGRGITDRLTSPELMVAESVARCHLEHPGLGSAVGGEMVRAALARWTSVRMPATDSGAPGGSPGWYAGWTREHLAAVLAGSDVEPARSGALALRSLEKLVGTQVVEAAVRSATQTSPGGRGRSLMAELSARSGGALGPLVENLVERGRRPDWRVESVERTGGGSRVTLARVGDPALPVEVLLVTAAGRSERQTWPDDGRRRWTFEVEDRLVEVHIDPERIWLVEPGRADNHWRAGGLMSPWLEAAVLGTATTVVLLLSNLPWG